MVLIIIVELSACMIVYTILNNSEWDIVRQKELQSINNIMSSVSNTLDLVEHNMDRTNAVFRSFGPNITKEQYEDIIHYDTLPIKDIIGSYFWMPKITYDQKDNFEDYCKKNIIDNCRIFEVNMSNLTQFVNVNKKEYYYPIIHAYPPLSSGDALIGFDMLSHPLTKIYIDIAEMNTSATMSFRINIETADNTRENGILINKFAFKNESNPNIHDVVGLSMGILNINRVVDYVIKTTKTDYTRSDINLIISDITGDVDNNTTNILYTENKTAYNHIKFDSDINSNDVHKINYSRHNRDWVFYFKFEDEYRNRIKKNESMITLLSLTGIFILLNIIVTCILILFSNLKRTAIEQHKSRVANQMLGYVNHEIRNPLNGISGLVELSVESLEIDYCKDIISDKIIFNKEIIATITSDLKTANRSCALLKHIVNDILDIRKLEEGKVTMHKENINVDKLLSNIHKTITPLLLEKPNVEFKIIINLNNKVIYVDGFRLTQILLNLLSNSIKFTIEGYIHLKVTNNNNNFIFSVEDTGRGIPDSKKDIIFQPFKQTTTDDSTRYGGVGLGLYLCQMLAKELGSIIEFESIYGEGSTFSIVFPCDIIYNDDINIEMKTNDIDGGGGWDIK